jgi:hypothetical protein
MDGRRTVYERACIYMYALANSLANNSFINIQTMFCSLSKRHQKAVSSDGVPADVDDLVRDEWPGQVGA